MPATHPPKGEAAAEPAAPGIFIPVTNAIESINARLRRLSEPAATSPLSRPPSSASTWRSWAWTLPARAANAGQTGGSRLERLRHHLRRPPQRRQEV